MLLNYLMPAFTVSSVPDVNLDQLWRQGIRGIFLDFDNTLVVWSDTFISTEVKNWVNQAKRRGFSLCIVSNAVTERLEKTSQELGIDFVAQAMKPSSAGLRRAMKKLGLTRCEVIMIGDQMFTDVLAGNLLGMTTALVTPRFIYEQWWMKGVRKLENFVQKYYKAA